MATLKEMLALVHVHHTLGHQCDGIHVLGNSTADMAAKEGVQTVRTVRIVAVTRSKKGLDNNRLKATGSGYD